FRRIPRKSGSFPVARTAKTHLLSRQPTNPTMKLKLSTSLAIALCLTATFIPNSVHAEWPARVFAPYMYIGAGDNFKLTDCDDACGLKYYTLAFIITQQEGRGKDVKYIKEPSWDGRIPIDQNLYHDQIDAVRKRGGDVIMSFGGEAGKELANVI